MSMRPVNFFSAWFCPYAQRAWLTLEHYQIPYNFIEALTVHQKQHDDDPGFSKSPRLLEINHKGQVPTLELTPEIIKDLGITIENIEKDPRVRVTDDSKSFVVVESIVCMDFLHSIASEVKNGNGNSLVPDIIPDNALLADVNKFDQEVCSTFYQILLKRTRDEQKDAYTLFSKGIAEFITYVQNDGYYKSMHPTIVDFAIIPWILRIPVLQNYRPTFGGMENFIGKEKNEKLENYIERIKGLDTVEKTLWSDEDAMNNIYKRYADGTT